MNAPTPSAGGPAVGSWRKSSYSAANNECVEIADLTSGQGVVGIRDSKDKGGPALRVDAACWGPFLEFVLDA